MASSSIPSSRASNFYQLATVYWKAADACGKKKKFLCLCPSRVGVDVNTMAAAMVSRLLEAGRLILLFFFN